MTVMELVIALLKTMRDPDEEVVIWWETRSNPIEVVRRDRYGRIGIGDGDFKNEK